MITQDQFNRYEAVRESGVTNMFDLRKVQAYTGLDKNDLIEIMKSYSELKQQYDS